MINYQLPNGRTIQLSIDQFLRMSDEDVSRLNEKHIGSCSSDPFDLTLEETEITEDKDFDLED